MLNNLKIGVNFDMDFNLKRIYKKYKFNLVSTIYIISNLKCGI